MKSHVTKWGNSLGVRIPSTWAKELGLEDGSHIDIEKVDGRLVLTRIEPSPRVSLSELLAAVTPESLHGETDWGTSEGDEVW